MAEGRRIIEDVLKQAQRQGFEVSRTGGDHYLVKGKGTRYTVPSTPGQGRATANAIAGLKRIGVVIENGPYASPAKPKQPEPEVSQSVEESSMDTSLKCSICQTSVGNGALLAVHDKAVHKAVITMPEAVKRILDSDPSRVWTSKEVTSVLNTNSNSSGPAFYRLLQRGGAVRHGHGKYQSILGVEQPAEPIEEPSEEPVEPEEVITEVEQPVEAIEPEEAPEPTTEAEEPVRASDGLTSGALLEVVAHTDRYEERVLILRDETGQYWSAKPF